MKKPITSNNAPAAIGPYSQGIKTDNLVFVSGQLPIDIETGSFPDDISRQTECCLINASSVLAEAGLSLSNVVKTTVFLKDLNNFNAMNEIYSAYFNEPYPARSTIEVARLPRDAMVEIEMIASF